MKHIDLTFAEFLLFNQDDQFGFFYDDDGYPTKDADSKFESNVAELFKKYEYISVDAHDNVYGVKDGNKEMLMANVMEAFEIANEVKTG
jgi:hypothetical protein